MAYKTEGKSEVEDTEIEVPSSSSIDGSLIFQIAAGFSLSLEIEILNGVGCGGGSALTRFHFPVILGHLAAQSDMTVEFDSLQTEYKELEAVLAQGEVNASSRRKHAGRKREVKVGIRRVEKLMSTVSDLKTAFRLIINEGPVVEDVILILGASPRRPKYVYEMCFSHGRMMAEPLDDRMKSRTTQSLSRKVIRALISKGVGSSSYEGPSKLFLLIKAPVSFSMPHHFSPKRDFQYSKKVSTPLFP
ncbi:hypothetical protein Ancab_019258 [Ancistrocladus abbreviatus]